MEIFIGALFLSIWHSILFWDKGIGLSGILFAIPLIYVTTKILKDKVENKKALLISIPIILLSSTYFIFDNVVFEGLNIIVIPVLYIIMMLLTITPQIKMKSIISKMINIVIEPINYFGEVFVEFKKMILNKFNIENKSKEKTERKNLINAIICTTIIVLLVLGLLISADTEFAKLFNDLEHLIDNLSVPTLVIRIGIIILAFFYISGFFMNILSKVNRVNDLESKEPKKKDVFTINMMITALNIVYIVFCFVQIKSFFTIENIKYSEYARQGFFQLMLVSLINITMILKATSKDLKETEKQIKYKKTMCIAMIVFTLLIIISSFTRMTLYQRQYGDTRLRILVDFTLLTETILLIPTAKYILNSKINLLKTYFIIITTMYCIINFANIDYIIAKRNVDRYIETGNIDLYYLTRGIDSTDVIKQLIRLKDTNFEYSKNAVYENEGEIVSKNLLNRYLSEEKVQLDKNVTWQEFNLSNWRAKKILEKVELEEVTLRKEGI